MPITSRLVRDGLEEIFYDIHCHAIRPGLRLAPKYLEGCGGEDCKTGRESWNCVEMGDVEVKVMNH